jgi:hypothetical protein
MNSPSGWVRCENFLLAPVMFHTPYTVGEGIRRRAISLLLIRRANIEVTRTLFLGQAALGGVDGVPVDDFTSRFNSYRASVVPFVEGVKKMDAKQIAAEMDKHLEKVPLVVKPLVRGEKGGNLFVPKMSDGEGGGGK